MDKMSNYEQELEDVFYQIKELWVSKFYSTARRWNENTSELLELGRGAYNVV